MSNARQVTVIVPAKGKIPEKKFKVTVNNNSGEPAGIMAALTQATNSAVQSVAQQPPQSNVEPVLANGARNTALPSGSNEGGRRNKRKGTRRNKRKGTRRNKRKGTRRNKRKGTRRNKRN